MSAAPNPMEPRLITTKSRGTMIKVPDATPGLLMVNGNQKPFTLEGVWKSPVAPAPNMTVEVEFDADNNIHSITVVDSAQLARERFHELSGKIGGKFDDLARNQGKDVVPILKEYLDKLRARMGTVALGAVVFLWLAWFFLPGYSADLGFLGHKSYTLWEFLGLNLSPDGRIEISHGLWGMLGIVCIAAPFLAPFIKDPRAKFANAAPLIYAIIAIPIARSSIVKLLAIPGMDTGPGVSMQWGTYLVLLACLVLAASIRKRLPG